MSVQTQQGKTILVTGAAGFLGSHLCAALLDAGATVIGVDNFYTGKAANIKNIKQNPRLTFLEHDIIQPLKLPKHIQLDEIYNLACPAAPKHYQYDPIYTVSTNVVGVLNMLKLAQAHGAKIMQASTSEVYGDPEVHPQTEDYVGHVNPIGIRSCYDEGKRCAETLMFDYQRQYDLNIKVVRIFNTYGPNMSVEDGRVVSNFILQALRNEPITIYGTGKQTRSFCYADDLVRGFISLMNDTPDEFTGPVNMGNPVEFTMLELAEEIIKQVDYTGELTFEDLPADDPTQRKPDISRAKAAMNWEPEIPLAEGLAKTIPYFKNIIEELKMKRVLFLSNTPSPYQVDFFNKLERATPVTGAFIQPEIKKNNVAWKLPNPDWANTLPDTNWLGQLKALYALVRGQNIKFVIIGGYKLKFAWLTLLWAKLNGIHTYFWMEPPEPATGIKKKIKFLMHRLILPRADGIFAIDNRAVEYYGQHHKHVVWLPYSIDGDRYTARAVKPDSKKPLKLLFVGQYIDRKGILEVIEAAKKWGADEAQMTFVGKGPMNDEIEALCKNTHHINLGFTQPKDLPKVFSEHDVFLFPSRYDGWGVVVAEAMACGLPVISSHEVGAFADLNKDKKVGYFCEITPDSIDNAVQQYIQNPQMVTDHSVAAHKVFKASLANSRNAAEYIMARVVSID